MANAVQSSTGTVVDTVVTFNIRSPKESVFIYLDYTKGNGTSVTMKLGSIHPKIHATNEYQHSEFKTATIAPITATFDATGKHRFEIPVQNGESKVKATFAFSGGDTQVVVCDLVPN
jgi:hypothetical protein